MRAQDPGRVSKAIGRRVAELRRERAMTQAQFAERLDVTVKYAQRIEAGTENLSVRSLVAIANALGVPAIALLERPTTLARPQRGRPPTARKG